MTRSVWATGFAALEPRADAAPARRGKPCGASHISAKYECGKSRRVNKVAVAALGVGLAAGAVYAATRRPASATRSANRTITQTALQGHTITQPLLRGSERKPNLQLKGSAAPRTLPPARSISEPVELLMDMKMEEYQEEGWSTKLLTRNAKHNFMVAKFDYPEVASVIYGLKQASNDDIITFRMVSEAKKLSIFTGHKPVTVWDTNFLINDTYVASATDFKSVVNIMSGVERMLQASIKDLDPQDVVRVSAFSGDSATQGRKNVYKRFGFKPLPGSKYLVATVEELRQRSRRTDAAPTRRGKPCGASHISREFRCRAGSSPQNGPLGKAGAAALGAGFIATGLVVAAHTRPWTRLDTRAFREAVAAGPWKFYERKRAADRKDPLAREMAAVRAGCRIDAFTRCRHQIGEPSAFGRVYLHPGNGLVYKAPIDKAKIGDFAREFEAHTAAFAAGAATPRPITLQRSTGVIGMEYIPGVKTFREIQKSQVPLTEAERYTMGSSLLETGRKLHRAGIAHNDLHQGNILVLPNREMQLIDYGQSKLFRRDSQTFVFGLDRDLPWMSGRIIEAYGLDADYAGIQSWMKQENRPFIQHMFRAQADPSKLSAMDVVTGVDAWYSSLNRAISFARKNPGVIARSTRI